MPLMAEPRAEQKKMLGDSNFISSPLAPNNEVCSPVCATTTSRRSSTSPQETSDPSSLSLWHNRARVTTLDSDRSARDGEMLVVVMMLRGPREVSSHSDISGSLQTRWECL